MDERCIGCPWFDKERRECERKPPRFCEVDRAIPDPRPEVEEREAALARSATNELQGW